MLFPLGVLAAWPWLSQVFSAMRVLFEEAMRTSETGGALPTQADFASSLFVPLLLIALVSAAVVDHPAPLAHSELGELLLDGARAPALTRAI